MSVVRTRPPRPDSAVFLVLAGLVVVATGIMLLPGVYSVVRSTTAHFTIEGFSIGAAAGAAALAFRRARSNPPARGHDILVSAGCLVLVVQALVLGVGANLWDNSPWEGFAFPAHAWQVGWLVAAACFALAARGSREAPAPPRALVGAIGALAAADIVLIVARQHLARASDLALAAAGAFEQTSLLHALLGGAVIALLGIAARFEVRASLSEGNPHSCLATGWLVACGAQILMIAEPSAFRPLLQAGDLVQATALALAFSGYVQAAGDRAGVETAAERGEIASMLSHEVRNPIASIRGLAATGSRMYERMTDEERREFFQLMDGEARRLSRVAESASTALRVDAGSLPFDPRPTPLARLVRDAAASVGVGAHPLELETDDDLRASVDSKRMTEAVAHLIDNAAKFSPPDAPIIVRVHREGDRALIDVLDRGPGIPAERREEVVRRFTRWRPAGYEEVPGSGLGLYIARAHVLVHDGDVLLDSGPAGGSMLRVILPLER